MNNSDITDPLFLQAVEAIDSGNISLVEELLQKNPQLVGQRLPLPDEGYFSHPYLLWFIADNPIRHEKLPPNIAAITNLIIKTIIHQSPDTLLQQLDYTLGLVVTGRIPRDCGVQIELIDLLIDAGATPGGGHGALAHGNLAAAERLIERGGELTLTTAICLDRKADITRLLKTATIADQQTALVAACFYGNTEAISILLGLGIDPNFYLGQSTGFHSHATALHQAVYSGSLDAVKALVKAGADLYTEDRIYHGTPLGWARHMQSEETSDIMKTKYAAIEAYLLKKQSDQN